MQFGAGQELKEIVGAHRDAFLPEIHAKMPDHTFEKIYDIIERIPVGKVATYGQIAALAGNPRAARTVGWALGSLKGSRKLPWHRVINSHGSSSFPDEAKRKLQQTLLEQEGIVFDRNGRVDLGKFLWRGEPHDG